LVDAGVIDARMLERARRVAAGTGARLGRVLASLGLVSERGLAGALANLLEAPRAFTSDYPDTALFPERPEPRFLRAAGAMPIAVNRGRTVLAMIDPLDAFTRNAVATAIGQPVALAVAIPVELEAAFERLYPETETEQEATTLLEEVVTSTSP